LRNEIRMSAFLRIAAATLFGYFFGYLSTAILVSIGIAASTLGIRSFILPGVAFWGNLLFLYVGRRLHVSGRANRAAGKAYLVLANHSSFYDIPALMAVVPDAALVGREKLMRIPVFRTLLKLVRYIPIDTDRVRKAHEAIVDAAHKARQGHSIAMFPEGTRTPDGKVQKLKRGFIYVLRESRLDVLPVTIRGTFALKPKSRFSIDPCEPIEVIIHPPIPNRDLCGLPDQLIMEKVRSAIEDGKGGIHEPE
jgi:1-acyl-sn-glycerol-3-phosphate acyltransferase